MSTPDSRRRRPRAAAGLCLALLMGGCSSTTPDYDARFGQAVRSSLQAQVIDPRAGEHDEAVSGLDGPAAREAVQRYRDSFKAPPPVVNVIQIGGAR